MSFDCAIRVASVSKRFEMYAKPRDRLLQFMTLGRRRFFQEFWALRDISLEVAKGETLGILGRNGSGKSTLLQIIAGTLTPTMGQVETVGTLAALLELGSGFNADFTGRENIYLNGSILGFSEREMDDRFDQIASFADIGAHLDQPVKTYSSGMYVRLAFAVQACVRPEILIVDEALSVGDEKFQRKCFSYIDQLRDDGCAILLVTHSTGTVEKFCQRAALLHQGTLHGVGQPKEIVDQYHALLYSDERAYLRYLNATQTAASPAEPAAERPAQASQVAAARSESAQAKALISRWEVLDNAGEVCESFRQGAEARIRFSIDVFVPLAEVQAGILIRTVEGVAAYGTSTSYHKKNFRSAQAGTTLSFEFVVRLALCPGAYFLSLAVAEPLTENDMAYLDRRSDAVVLQVSEHRSLGSGIAALDCAVRDVEVCS